MENETVFYWQRHAEVEDFFLRYIDRFCKESPTLARFAAKLVDQTSTGMLDWVDHILLPDARRLRDELQQLGFVRQAETGSEAFFHAGVLLPSVLLAGDSADPKRGVALRVESITDFLQVNGFRAEIEGQPLSRFRRALVSVEKGSAFMAVERRGSLDYVPATPADEYLKNYLEAIETWQNIPRGIDDEDKALTEILATAENLVKKVGQNPAAHIVCLGERNYWLSRNYAARVQKSRQDTLGLGWANHDHHTFRSSRRHFSKLIALFSRLGFRRRERYYAGSEAGWGAQIMENEGTGLVLFLDVDLEPEEVDVDFSVGKLLPGDRLGTVGLWCALHGDSILKAGMHHLAARFDFDLLTDDIAQFGVEFMAPFSDFSYLKQAFSVAERWQVEPQRVHELLDRKAITAEQADRFLARGAVGSHLENIQRREGYKGFNKKNVSAIIKETDPRRRED
jgi:hypothetical protein